MTMFFNVMLQKKLSCLKTIALLIFAMMFFTAPLGYASSVESHHKSAITEKKIYPIPLSDYKANNPDNVLGTLSERINQEPFNLFVSAVFILAILHTFAHRNFLKLSQLLSKRLKERIHSRTISPARKDISLFFIGLFKMLGEVELIFGMWLLPLLIGFSVYFGWDALCAYLDTLAFDECKFVEPVFVVVVMCMAGTRPIIQVAEDFINVFSKILGGSVASWWVSIFLIGSLLGSFITEPAAITICATLLAEKFFANNPSTKFKYATLGLLLTAISAGGTLTHFSSPPVLMVAIDWNWDMMFMLSNFGWKAVLGIFLAVATYYIVFSKELKKLNATALKKTFKSKESRVPTIIVLIHLMFLTFAVACLHQPVLFMIAFAFFIGFIELTHNYQYSDIGLKSPILVGVFLGALVIHGSLQGWWIEPVLMSISGDSLFFIAEFLSAFNDNAAITYLATLVPNFSDEMKYLIVGGAVAGGGLTVIANAPNPAGIAILKKYFKGGVSPVSLFLGALLPTIFISACYFFL